MNLSIEILAFGSRLPRAISARTPEFILEVCSSENQMALSGRQIILAVQECPLSKIGVHFLACTFLMSGPIIRTIDRRFWSTLLAHARLKYISSITVICLQDQIGSFRSV